ncbi:DUF2218 domain-containing protein [Agrobacterium sp. SORGH_AS 787]|uniref:DUF2218 domain-containing protein n=1 Tax=Agrobacterium sp. SORGH_AS 787 TaxID=3041775 RepID=UPI00277F8547|nr:hypothetical protein [Rhizobium sp. SORGH_AS_0787]
MSTSRVEVTTQHASRYLQQLAKHWAHKFETEFTPLSSKIALPLGDAQLSANDTSLIIEVVAHKSEDLSVLQDVVQRHIERFAFKESLAFEWRPLA